MKKISFIVLISISLSACTTKEFITPSDSKTDLTNTSSGTVTDINGNIYKTIKIGTQVWMTENLKVTKFRNGTSIANTTDFPQWASLTTSAWCNFENISQYNTIYGKLYNWYAVNDSRKICPTGWHMPCDAEWTTLTTNLGGESVAGDKLKEAGLTHWQSPNTSADNSSGFTALPGGCRIDYGSFNYIESFGFWWSSTEYNATNAWRRRMNYSNGEVSRSNDAKAHGFSVRCISD